jgi:hypothetical protein
MFRAIAISTVLFGCLGSSAQAQCTGWIPMSMPAYGDVTSGDSRLVVVDYDAEGPRAPLLYGLGLRGVFRQSFVEEFDKVDEYDGFRWRQVGRVTGSSRPEMGGRGWPLNVGAWRGDLVVCGLFEFTDGLPTRNIARWDGARWHDIGGGTNGIVYAVVEYEGMLIASGEFTEAGGVTCNNVAAWDGTSWRNMNDGLGRYSHFRHFHVRQGQLLGVGWNISPIMRWDGPRWQPAGPDLQGEDEGPTVYLDLGDTQILGVNHSYFPDRNAHVFQNGSWTPRCISCAGWAVSSVDSLLSHDIDGDGRPGVVALVFNYDWSTEDQEYRIVGSTSDLAFDFEIPAPSFRVWALTSYAGELIYPFHRYVTGSPYPQTQTGNVLTCPGGTAEFFFGVTNTLSPPTYRWSKDGAGLADGPTGHGSVISGSSTPTLRVEGVHAEDQGEYTCGAVNGTCGEVTSAPARLTVCVAEFDCNGSVDFFDYLDFVQAFSDEDSRADLNADARVDFFDYLDFIQSFEAGCE